MLPTPVGPMLALASDDALCALEFGSDNRMSRLEARLLALLRRTFGRRRIERRDRSHRANGSRPILPA
jgi:hypothetical protein